MTPEQIEKWDVLATAYAESNARTSDEWSTAWRMQFARLVAADMWERAAKAVPERCTCVSETDIVRGRDKTHDVGCPRSIVLAIRAAAAKEAKP